MKLAGAILALLFGASAALADTNSFALSGTVADVVSYNEQIHSADGWVAPVVPCDGDTYAMLYVRTGDDVVRVYCTGSVACAAWNKKPGDRVRVRGDVAAVHTGRLAEQVETVLVARDVR